MRKLSITIIVFGMLFLLGIASANAETGLELVDRMCREKWKMPGAKALAATTHTINEVGYEKAKKYLYYYQGNYSFKVSKKLGKYLLVYSHAYHDHSYSHRHKPQFLVIDTTKTTKETKFYLDKAQKGSWLTDITGGRHYMVKGLLGVEIDGFDKKIPIIMCVSTDRNRSMWKVKYKK